jgi:hypothetical protein
LGSRTSLPPRLGPGGCYWHVIIAIKAAGGDAALR